MTFGSDFVLRSYVKTTVACLALFLVALSTSIAALYWLPKFASAIGAAVGAVIALSFLTLACAGLVVLARYRRSSNGGRDLFLELNRSREPSAIRNISAARVTRARRWLAQCLLGHELVVGDQVEIKTWLEIRATLDERGCMDELPFMPEMLAMCGQRAYVFRCVHRLFDYRKTRQMRHMEGTVLLVGAVCNGASHGGCEAACHTIWKSAWLRRVDGRAHKVSASASDASEAVDITVLQFGTQPPRYTCQLTQLQSASRPVSRWSVTNFVRPLIAGNVTLPAFVVGWLTRLFDELQHQRQGVGFPAFEPVAQGEGRLAEARPGVGDRIVVKSSSDIRATLNEQLMHRGLWFEPDMMKHCGQRAVIQAEVTKLIDIVSGEMLNMKTPAYILRDVHFSGERQLFNAQYEPLFWRGAWLRPDGD